MQLCEAHSAVVGLRYDEYITRLLVTAHFHWIKKTIENQEIHFVVFSLYVSSEDQQVVRLDDSGATRAAGLSDTASHLVSRIEESHPLEDFNEWGDSNLRHMESQ